MVGMCEVCGNEDLLVWGQCEACNLLMDAFTWPTETNRPIDISIDTSPNADDFCDDQYCNDDPEFDADDALHNNDEDLLRFMRGETI